VVNFQKEKKVLIHEPIIHNKNFIVNSVQNRIWKKLPVKWYWN